MIITASDRITALAAVVAATGATAQAPTEATEVEGKWLLKGQPPEEPAALIIDRYGLRVVWVLLDEDGNIRENVRFSAAYLAGEAAIDLRHHLDGLWQCPECGYWMRGAGICCLCQGRRI